MTVFFTLDLTEEEPINFIAMGGAEQRRREVNELKKEYWNRIYTRQKVKSSKDTLKHILQLVYLYLRFVTEIQLFSVEIWQFLHETENIKIWNIELKWFVNCADCTGFLKYMLDVWPQRSSTDILQISQRLRQWRAAVLMEELPVIASAAY